MGFWTWMAIAVVLVGSFIAANSVNKKTEKRHVKLLIWFIIGVILFFIWWFTRAR
ncbi:hypothetical protein [Pseudalkalibacillus sp. SCS-8]|uniref:hypothetical protein n=1 Tax=Pseudalkalibacillus nanhaiensis TaxID=3115291 RepID=UPI0032DA3379